MLLKLEGPPILLLFFWLCCFSPAKSQSNDIQCPRGWIEHRNHCYKFTRTPLRTRDEAFKNCREYEAELVSVNTEDEHRFMIKWLRDNDPQQKKWYTSGNWKGTAWFWDGDDTQFQNIPNMWLNNNPDAGSGQDAIYTFSSSDGRWGLVKVEGFERYGYICEIPKQKLNLNKFNINERGLDFGITVVDERFIPRAPKFVIEPVDVIYDTDQEGRGRDVKLRCVADGYPFPEYRWFKEERKLLKVVNKIIKPLEDSRITQTDGTLAIRDPSKFDVGNYHCLAKNKFGTVISKTVQLGFGYISQFSDGKKREVGKAYWGKAIYCEPPPNYPGVRYFWNRNEFPKFVQGNSRIFISHDGHLYFSSLEKSDKASYSCNVRSIISDLGRTGPFIKLEVSDTSSNQLLQFPNNFPKVFPEIPLAGQDVRLECLAFGFPIPSYSWARKGLNRNLPSKAVVLESNHVLLLPNISVEDNGEYECIATNSRTTIRNSVLLNIRADPVFTIPLEDKFLDAGSELTWLCEAFGIPEVDYKWMKNGQELNLYELPAEDRDRYKINKNMLTIQYVDANRDEGVYQCKALNTLSSSYSAGWLRVLSFKPSFKKYPLPEEIYAVIGGSVTIPCNPEGAPKPSFVWRRNGAVLGNSGNVKILNNGHLRIDRVRKYQDEGTYSCRAKNEFGADQSSGRLVVLKEPTMSRKPPMVQTIRVNESYELPCEVTTYGTLLETTILWLKNGVPIDFETQPFVQTGSRPGYLRIPDAKLEHSGNYSCMIKTPLISITQSTYLKFEGPPGAPGGISAFNPSPTSIELQWSDGAVNGGQITSYIIEGETENQDGWKVLVEEAKYVKEDNKGMKIYKLNGVLSPFNIYRFRISSVNEYGIGPPSFSSPQYSVEGAKPMTYPENVGGGGGKIGDLTIKWDTLPRFEWNSDKVWYAVHWREKDSVEEFIVRNLTHMGNINLYVVSVGPENFYSQYEIKVHAENEFGAGPISPSVIIWSAEDLPLDSPNQVSLEAYNSTAMMVSWTAVTQHRAAIRGTLVGHRIKYWIGKDPEVTKDPDKAQAKLIRGTKPEGMIVGLLPNTWYTITVSIYNNAGSGPMSKEVTYRTFKKAPQNAPTSVEVSKISRTSVSVIWRYMTPGIGEEPIIGFKVRYWRHSESISNARDVYSYREDSSPEARITDLVPGELYLIRVLAFSRGGDGRMSSPIKKIRLN